MSRIFTPLIGIALLLSSCSPSDIKDDWEGWTESPRRKSVLAEHESQKAKGIKCAKRMKSFEGSTAQKEDRLLAFAFPDGVRSQPGKVQGQAKWDGSNYGNNCIYLKFEECAGVPVFHEHGWSHISFALTPSSNKDSHVVRCAIETLYGRFNVGIVGPDRANLLQMDEKPFEKLVRPYLAKSQKPK